MGFFHRLGQKIKSGIQSVGSKVANVSTAIGNKVGGGIINEVSAIDKTAIGSVIDDATGLGTMASKVGAEIQGVGVGVGGAITGATGVLTGNLKEAERGVKSALSGGVEALSRSQALGTATKQLVSGNFAGAEASAVKFGVGRAKAKVMGKGQKVVRGKVGLSKLDDVVRYTTARKVGKGAVRSSLLRGLGKDF